MSERQMWEFPSKMIEYAQKLLSIPEDAIVEIRAPIDQDFFHDDVPKVVLSPEILRELARNYLKTHQVVEADPEF